MITLKSKRPDNLFNFYNENFSPSHLQETNGVFKGYIGLEPKCEVEIVYVDSKQEPMNLTVHLDDIDEPLLRLEIPKYGARIISEKEEKGDWEEMTLKDPDGNTVILISKPTEITIEKVLGVNWN